MLRCRAGSWDGGRLSNRANWKEDAIMTTSEVTDDAQVRALIEIQRKLIPLLGAAEIAHVSCEIREDRMIRKDKVLRNVAVGNDQSILEKEWGCMGLRLFRATVKQFTHPW
jgi:hypothetical protein